MAERIHILIDAGEKERYRRMAEKEGKTLSAWLRDAAEEKLMWAEGREELGSREELRAFFDACDRRERGREPDWEDHLRVIGRSREAGATET